MMNKFSIGSQVGGEAPGYEDGPLEAEQELRRLICEWRGNYTSAIQDFYFVLRIDGPIDKYTEMWDIVGAQPAKRKGSYLEVEIGVPETWWVDTELSGYRTQLVDELEKGLNSMIALLKRNNHEIDDRGMLRDWLSLKDKFIAMGRG